MALKESLIDELLKDTKTPEDLLGKNGLLKMPFTLKSKTMDILVVKPLTLF